MLFFHIHPMNSDAAFENTLERLLTEALASAGARPHFYRELLHATVLLCPHGEFEENGDSAKGTATLKMEAITHEGVHYIPFFLAEKFLPSGARYIPLPAKTFFAITKGSHLVLNPGSQAVKTFTPQEVDQLLSGQILEVESVFQAPNSAKLIVGRPVKIPDGLREQLSRFFAAEDGVMKAWLAWYHNPAVEKAPGYLLAIETPRTLDFRALAGRTSLVLKEVGTGGPYCDIVRYEGTGLTNHFRFEKPFYSKPPLTRLKAAIFG
ncbi:MAG: hypothetical protein RLZZ15_2944 [Verrucomicrobiota bacterium]|jgi:hypothetical protein